MNAQNNAPLRSPEPPPTTCLTVCCTSGNKRLQATISRTKYITGHAMYVERDIDVSTCNHCCRGKATRITYSECVSVVLPGEMISP